MKTDKYLENAATTGIMIEAGYQMMRQNIRRKHPNATDRTVEELLNAWACRENDPMPGDTTGAVRVRQRSS